MKFTDLIVTIPAGKKSVVLAWLLSKGVDVNRDEDGIMLTRDQKVIGKVCTPMAKDINNAIFFRIRFKENVANQIPDKPLYILWRSDDLVDGELKPEPVYEGINKQHRICEF